MNTEFFCSVFSSQAGEALFGTATRTLVYLLLEYTGAWGKKAFEESDLSLEIKAHLSAAKNSLSACKIQLIKGRPELEQKGARFYVASAAERSPALYSFHLDSYSDLLGLDILAIAAGSPEYASQRQAEPLYLVCTNGRRDPCCARFGLPVYTEILKTAGESAWQSTHVGGHRFAANFNFLPYGVLYGRLTPVDVPAVLDACQRGQLDLAHYRGRTCYEEAAQAGEYFLRQETGRLAMDAFLLQETRQSGPQQWQVAFQDSVTGESHWLEIAEQTGEATVYESCRMDKAAPLVSYRLLDHTSQKARQSES